MQEASEEIEAARTAQQVVLRNCFRDEFKTLFPSNFESKTMMSFVEVIPSERFPELFEPATFEAFRTMSKTRNLLQLIEQAVQDGELTAEEADEVLQERLEKPLQKLQEQVFPKGRFEEKVTKDCLRHFVQKRQIEPFSGEALEARKEEVKKLKTVQ